MTNKRVASMLSAALFGCLLSSQALAHVTLETQSAEPGSFYKAVLKLPHGCDGSPTVKLEVDLPDGFISAKPMVKPGWTIETEKGAYDREYAFLHGMTLKDGVRKIVWSGGEVPEAFYDEFVVTGFLATELEPGPIYFPVKQVCAEGDVSWSELPKDGEDPHSLKAPAPQLMLNAPAEAGGHHHP
ncbi:YcnI family copper-binding membrane protein [Methyloligella solikamskensis]|uniref:YcnI family protein n=1 Tax=Methyloligella solikamskensis TaxID=1177756 RepID=A0ABW3JB76_9HYPH